MKRLLLTLILCLIGHNVLGSDTDGDGLLDLLDVPGFDPNLSGSAYFPLRGVEDLDGASLLRNVTEMDLATNRVESIESGDFKGLTNLRTLNLSSNRIARLNVGDFQDLSGLTALHLDGNRIASIESGVFEGLSGLRVLGLVGNALTSLDDGDFDGLIALDQLYLHANELVSIEASDFRGLSNLRLLTLGENNLTSIEYNDFQYLRSLEHLDLVGNRITTVDGRDFDKLDNLKTLNLLGNRITQFDPSVLQELPSLDRLYLGYNKFTTLPPGTFRHANGIRHLDLRGNQLTQINLSGASFSSLEMCDDFAESFVDGFCVDTLRIQDLILDEASLSRASFDAIVFATLAISRASLVGIHFSDGYPDSLKNFLSGRLLNHLQVDQELFDRYSVELQDFADTPGNSLVVVPEGFSSLELAILIVVIFHHKRWHMPPAP